MNISCCDRCGKKVSDTLHQSISTNYVGANGNMSYGGVPDIDIAAKFDLCAECWEEFKKFMRINQRQKDYEKLCDEMYAAKDAFFKLFAKHFIACEIKEILL